MKTLKDIDGNYDDDNAGVNSEDLKEAAREWVTELERLRDENINVSQDVREWITTFFNLEEE